MSSRGEKSATNEVSPQLGNAAINRALMQFSNFTAVYFLVNYN